MASEPEKAEALTSRSNVEPPKVARADVNDRPFDETPVWDALVAELGDPFPDPATGPDNTSSDGGHTPADGDRAPDPASSVPERATFSTLAGSGVTSGAQHEP